MSKNEYDYMVLWYSLSTSWLFKLITEEKLEVQKLMDAQTNHANIAVILPFYVECL